MLHRRLTKKEAKELSKEVASKGYKAEVAKDCGRYVVFVKGRK